MKIDPTIYRAQNYRFLADVFLYPTENWLEDLHVLAALAHELNAPLDLEVGVGNWDLPSLQAEHRRCFGLVGSLCYETEYGLPHEFRQSQELADIAGFYRAFGFKMGGPVRERPDHIAAELEFMHVLTLKEAYALQGEMSENTELCADAQRKFLTDHLGRWTNLFAASLALSAVEGPYLALAQFVVAFIKSDAERLGIVLEPLPLTKVKPTPLGPELSCGDCPAANGVTP